ncbi:MAG: ATP-binding cassette domain-containing protein [Candidatus Heimdallarchaeota archaeon]|nr:ATP-binding cassette domain-containing protein [Candidatus Heimdallarchaeota archaeon]
MLETEKLVSKTITNNKMQKNEENILTLRDVHKKYNEGKANELHVLKGVSFQIPNSQIVAIMGPSGCGKTTLLNLIGGLDKKTKGTIKITGKTLAGLSEQELTNFRRDNIGFIFQLFNLFEDQNLLENVSLPLIIQGVPIRKARNRAEQLLAAFNLEDRKFEKPNKLSGGEKQAVAIARTLITQPCLILGDEPTGDLDENTATKIMQIFREIVDKNPSVSIIVVTHSMFIAKQCDRILRLENGVITNDFPTDQKDQLNKLEYTKALEKLQELAVKVNGQFSNNKRKAIISAKSLKKIYVQGQQKVTALDDVSLDVFEGEFLVIFGPSGAGKTTLLNLLAGLDTPDEGEILFKKENLINLSDRQKSKLRNKHFSFIFQNYGLLPHLTALENVAIPQMMKKSPELTKAEILKILEEIDIAEFQEHKPAYLSGGQRQRVGIGRALANQPSVLFGDEPTGDLDEETSEKVMGIIDQYHQKRNMTIVMATHNPKLAQKASRIVFLKDGKIVSSLQD